MARSLNRPPWDRGGAEWEAHRRRRGVATSRMEPNAAVMSRARARTMDLVLGSFSENAMENALAPGASLNFDLEEHAILNLQFTTGFGASQVMSAAEVVELLEYRLCYDCDKAVRTRQLHQAKEALEAARAQAHAKAIKKRAALESREAKERKRLDLPPKEAREEVQERMA
jgi:hypothetical protein